MYHWLTNYKLHSRVMTARNKLLCGCLCLTIVDSICIYRKLAAFFFAHKNISGCHFFQIYIKKKNHVKYAQMLSEQISPP